MERTLRKAEKNDFFQVLATFIVVYCSKDTLLFGTNSNKVAFWLHLGILCVLLFCCALKCGLRVSIRSVHLIFLLSTLLVLTCLFNWDLSIKYGYELFAFLFALFFVSCISLNSFVEAFCKVITLLSAASIILFILCFLGHSILRIFPKIVNESGYEYFFLGLGVVENIPATDLPRSYGIFREPGIFIIYLSTALIFELFFTSHINKYRVVIFVLALFLTFSTAGYILYGSIFLILCLHSLSALITPGKTKSGALKVVLTVLCVVAFLFFLFDADVIYGAVFKKLSVKNTSRDSRFGSFAANFKIFIEKPLWGAGWTFTENNFARYEATGMYSGGHNTNTFMKILAGHGAVFFLLVIGCSFNLFKQLVQKKMLAFVLFVVWVAALSNGDLCMNTLLYVIVFYGAQSTAFLSGKDRK